MEKNPLLSIIIPVYNLQEYIVGCLDSIYSQKVDESSYEVVAVDDGSKDDSLQVLRDYALNHRNLIVLHQENGGVSRARNLAISKSSGGYLTFVDGDDKLYDNSLPQLMEEIKNSNQFDIMYCRCYWSMPDGEEMECKVWNGLFNTETAYSGRHLLRKAYAHGGAIWGGIFQENVQ